MNTDADPYDAAGFYTDTDAVFGHDHTGAPVVPSEDIAHSMELRELANLLKAAGASKSMRARVSQQLTQGSNEDLPHNHRFNEYSNNSPPNETFLNNDQSYTADPDSHQYEQAPFHGHMIDEANSNNHRHYDISMNNSDFSQAESDSHQFDQTFLDTNTSDQGHSYHHPANVMCTHNQFLVDTTLNSEETDTLNGELPNFKRRRTENGEPSYLTQAHEHTSVTTSAARASLASVSTDRSSRFSASTARSSYLSTSTSRSSVASMMSPAALENQSNEEVAYKYKCLICHMGEGDSRKAYVRKEGSTPNDQAAVNTPESITKASSGRAPKPKNSWNRQTLLEKHIRENHLFMFQRTNSSEYTCIFCPCGTVQEQPCAGRLPDKDTLLTHVSTQHHEIPHVRVRYDHLCAPLDSRSYRQKLLDRLKRRDVSASD